MVKLVAKIPSVRQIEALLLRSEGRTFAEVARLMGVTTATAAQLSRSGAIKLLRYTPKPTMEGLAEKARVAYPHIAARYPKKTKETA